MATIPQVERNAAIDALMLIAGEDQDAAGRILDFLRTAFPAFDWVGILRTRARNWAPYVDAGVSIDQYIDGVVSIADDYARAHT